MARPTSAANSRSEAIVVEETGLGAFACGCPIQLSLGRALEVRTELLSEAVLDDSLAETRGGHMRQIMNVCEG
jgi:hypothetical protein